MAGSAGMLLPSSSVIAILKVESTITTTLAPTSSARILEVTADGSLALSRAGSLNGLRAALSPTGAAAGQAGRAEKIKLDALLCSRAPAVISLIALSEAAMRSDGEGTRPEGRV